MRIYGQTINEATFSDSILYSVVEEAAHNDPEIGSVFAQIIPNFISSKLDIDSDGDGLLGAVSASNCLSATSTNMLRDQLRGG